MRVLPDTHILVWALTDDKRLSSKAREIIMDPDHAIFYSAVSTWEIYLINCCLQSFVWKPDSFLWK